MGSVEYSPASDGVARTAPRPANARAAGDRFRKSRRCISTSVALTVLDGFTSYIPKIVYRYLQILALDALYDGCDLGVAGGGNANLCAFVDDMALDEIDFGAAPLG